MQSFIIFKMIKILNCIVFINITFFLTKLIKIYIHFILLIILPINQATKSFSVKGTLIMDST